MHTSLVANYFTDSNFRRKSYRQVSSKSIFSLLQTLAKIFLTKFERVSRKRENEGQCRRRRPEWPDAELFSSPNFSKSCPKVTHSRLSWKVALFTLAQKSGMRHKLCELLFPEQHQPTCKYKKFLFQWNGSEWAKPEMQSSYDDYTSLVMEVPFGGIERPENKSFSFYISFSTALVTWFV